MEIALVNRIGREILYTLDYERYHDNYGSWALKVGRKNFDLPVEGKLGKKFVAQSILQIVLMGKNPENFEVCMRDTNWVTF